VSNNSALEVLFCSDNKIKSLDIRNNTSLRELFCSYNELTILDISENTALEKVYCYHNLLTDLDVSNNTSLKNLDFSLNLLTSLDITNNTDLESLACSNNELQSLEISKNYALNDLDCSLNHLISLDLSQNFTLAYLNAKDNPNLYCIQIIDSAKAANDHHWHKDDWAIYSEDCRTVGVDEEIDELNDISISPNRASDYIEITNLGEHTGSPLGDIKIYNSLGECVLTPLAFGEGPGVRLDISPLPPGVYFVRIGYENRKFIKY